MVQWAHHRRWACYSVVTVEHSLWTASEDESDFSLCVGLVKHVPIGNAE